MEQLARPRSRTSTTSAMDWSFDGEEFDEETKLRAETRKILELPDLPVSATCVRVPVMVGHAEAVWLETEEPLSAAQARELLGGGAVASGSRSGRRPGSPPGGDDVLVGRIRGDRAGNGLAFMVVCDNLRKGAALNAIQIMELLLERSAVAAADHERLGLARRLLRERPPALAAAARGARRFRPGDERSRAARLRPGLRRALPPAGGRPGGAARREARARRDRRLPRAADRPDPRLRAGPRAARRRRARGAGHALRDPPRRPRARRAALAGLGSRAAHDPGARRPLSGDALRHRRQAPARTALALRETAQRRITSARRPSSTGTSPPSSSRASSTRPCVRTVRKPKSERKSLGKTVRWTRKRSYARLALRVAVGEGLERLRAAVARVADRREEERLEHPRARAVDEVRAGDEHRVVGGRARRELRRAREEIRRPVLHRAEQRAVVVVVQLPPDPPLLLGLLDPAALVGRAAVARLPPDALVADGRRRLERRAGHPRETSAHAGGPISSTTTSTRSGSISAIRSR